VKIGLFFFNQQNHDMFLGQERGYGDETDSESLSDSLASEEREMFNLTMPV